MATAAESASRITCMRYCGSALICASVKGITCHCLAEKARVWSLACAEPASLDSEKASNPKACGPLLSKVTSCK
ncbi:hypothetical protein D3C76_1760810 [compost metagenome]